MTDEPTAANISQEPVNVLFNPSKINKSNVWEIDLIHILDILLDILKKTGKNKDLRVAGMAALSSSLIYRMKVESIFALQKIATEQSSDSRKRTDVNIPLLDIPYRHESTYPVTLDELLELLENLIGTIANPRTNNRGLNIQPIDPPDFKQYFSTLENIIQQYEDLVITKVSKKGTVLFSKIVSDLDVTDSIRCFFAILFLARDVKVDLEQKNSDILVSLIT